MPSLTKLVAIPSGVNGGLTSPSSSVMLSLLGNPRSNYSQDCQPVTNKKLKAHIKTKHVGPFRATGFDLAVDSLAQVMADINAEQPAVFAALSSAGMLCCRFKRGSSSSISNHAWGTAIDLKLNGILDARGDRKVQFGLTLIAPIFNRHKWYWGATFPTEDAMHFEISAEKLRAWQDAGKLLSGGGATDDNDMMLGERSMRVKELQQRLNKLGEKLKPDGIFGPMTHAAVQAFQGANGFPATGIVTPTVFAKLVSMT
jgi:hypothetical protein